MTTFTGESKHTTHLRSLNSPAGGDVGLGTEAEGVVVVDVVIVIPAAAVDLLLFLPLPGDDALRSNTPLSRAAAILLVVITASAGISVKSTTAIVSFVWAFPTAFNHLTRPLNSVDDGLGGKSQLTVLSLDCALKSKVKLARYTAAAYYCIGVWLTW